MAKNITDQDMDAAGLSKEEREALAGEETIDTQAADDSAADTGEDKGESDEGKGSKPGSPGGDGASDDAGKAAEAGKAGAAGGEGGADGVKPGTPDNKGGDGGGDAGGADAADAGKPAAVAAGVQAGADAPLFVPRVEAKAPEKYDERIATLTTAEDANDTKYSDGDITLKEWRTEQRRIQSEREGLIREQTQYETLETINSSNQASAWKYQQDTFFSKAENQVYAKDAAYAALNVHVKAVANEEAFKTKSGLEVLREADRRFRADFGLPAPGAAKADDGKTVTGPDGKPLKVSGQQSEDRGGVPRTLAGIPAAGDADVNDEFSKLDALEGMELEEAISELERTNPLAARRYLESASQSR